MRELEVGVAVLRRIEHKLDKIRQKYGLPSSFGAWVQRVCAAIGLDKVSFPGEEGYVNPDDAATRIDRIIADWEENAKERRYI